MATLQTSTVPATETSPWDVEVFFDGDCPLCRREIGMLRRWDRKQRIRFTDICGEGFDTQALGIDFEQLMAEIHGRLPDGTIIRGVEVFRRLYAAVGWRRLAAVTGWPIIRNVLNVGYRLFARNRLRLTGRCTTACKVERSP